MIALIVSLMLWTHPVPQLWACTEGKQPAINTTPVCTQIPYRVLTKFPAFK